MQPKAILHSMQPTQAKKLDNHVVENNIHLNMCNKTLSTNIKNFIYFN